MATADKLTVEEVIERVADIEQQRAGYRKMARQWEKMWALKVFKQTAEEKVRTQGQVH